MSTNKEYESDEAVLKPGTKLLDGFLASAPSKPPETAKNSVQIESCKGSVRTLVGISCGTHKDICAKPGWDAGPLGKLSVFMTTPRTVAHVGRCCMTSLVKSEILLSERHRSYCVPRNRATDVRPPWPIHTTCGRRVQRTARCKMLEQNGASQHATDETRRTQGSANFLWKPPETNVHV